MNSYIAHLGEQRFPLCRNWARPVINKMNKHWSLEALQENPEGQQANNCWYSINMLFLWLNRNIICIRNVNSNSVTKNITSCDTYYGFS